MTWECKFPCQDPFEEECVSQGDVVIMKIDLVISDDGAADPGAQPWDDIYIPSTGGGNSAPLGMVEYDEAVLWGTGTRLHVLFVPPEAIRPSNLGYGRTANDNLCSRGR